MSRHRRHLKTNGRIALVTGLIGLLSSVLGLAASLACIAGAVDHTKEGPAPTTEIVIKLNPGCGRTPRSEVPSLP